jgi:hypothetical protein
MAERDSSAVILQAVQIASDRTGSLCGFSSTGNVGALPNLDSGAWRQGFGIGSKGCVAYVEEASANPY